MRPSPAYRRALRVAPWAVLVAFAHQLGACSCGCLEHNGWYQSVVTIAGEPHLAEPDHHGPAIDHEHCDGGSAAPCVAASRVEVGPLLADGFVLSAWPSATPAYVAGTRVSSSSGVCSEEFALCAPAARATVWRL